MSSFDEQDTFTWGAYLLLAYGRRNDLSKKDRRNVGREIKKRRRRLLRWWGV